MLVEIKRGVDDPHSVPSEVFVDGKFQCYGLEPARKDPVHPDHPCIAAGTYEVVRSLSPHLHYVTPILLHVKDRSEIRWHIANYPKDLLGCLGVGVTRDKDFVGNSRTAFEELITLLDAAWDRGEKILAVYTDPI